MEERCRARVPYPENPGFPSKIRLPSNTNTIPIPVCTLVITGLSWISKQYHNIDVPQKAGTGATVGVYASEPNHCITQP